MSAPTEHKWLNRLKKLLKNLSDVNWWLQSIGILLLVGFGLGGLIFSVYDVLSKLASGSSGVNDQAIPGILLAVLSALSLGIGLERVAAFREMESKAELRHQDLIKRLGTGEGSLGKELIDLQARMPKEFGQERKSLDKFLETLEQNINSKNQDLRKNITEIQRTLTQVVKAESLINDTRSDRVRTASEYLIASCAGTEIIRMIFPLRSNYKRYLGILTAQSESPDIDQQVKAEGRQRTLKVVTLLPISSGKRGSLPTAESAMIDEAHIRLQNYNPQDSVKDYVTIKYLNTALSLFLLIVSDKYLVIGFPRSYQEWDTVTLGIQISEDLAFISKMTDWFDQYIWDNAIQTKPPTPGPGQAGPAVDQSAPVPSKVEVSHPASSRGIPPNPDLPPPHLPSRDSG